MVEREKHREVIALFGRTGTGKTYLSKKLLLRFRRQIVVDMNEEYDATFRARAVDEFLSYVQEHESENFRIAVTFEDDADVDTVFLIAWELPGTLIVVDDAAIYLQQPSKNLLRLVRRGRHKAINLMFISQRIPDIHPNIRAQLSTIITFNQIELEDIDRAVKMGLRSPAELKGHEYAFIGNEVQGNTTR